MNILVTGANGQLGNEMRRVAAERSDNYTFTDVAELDITDIDAVCAKVKETKADVIVNCAGAWTTTSTRISLKKHSEGCVVTIP